MTILPLGAASLESQEGLKGALCGMAAHVHLLGPRISRRVERSLGCPAGPLTSLWLESQEGLKDDVVQALLHARLLESQEGLKVPLQQAVSLQPAVDQLESQEGLKL